MHIIASCIPNNILRIDYQANFLNSCTISGAERPRQNLGSENFTGDLKITRRLATPTSKLGPVSLLDVNVRRERSPQQTQSAAFRTQTRPQSNLVVKQSTVSSCSICNTLVSNLGLSISFSSSGRVTSKSRVLLVQIVQMPGNA